MTVRKTVMVVDDHVEMVELLADELSDAGYDVVEATSGKEALGLLARARPDVVLTDLRMHGVDGFDVLEHVQRALPDTPVIMMTAFGAIETAVEAMKRGAFHYVSKPFRADEVLVLLQRAIEATRMRAENRALRAVAADRSSIERIVGTSAAVVELRKNLTRLAAVDAPVLVRGESGTGKELVARALHFAGPRANRSFVAVNCTTLPRDLLESELFGHVRGSFTGAATARKGLFLEADGGTLFLDEIGDMPLELQAKLLRVLEEHEVRPVGSDDVVRVDVRVVAATHQPLEERVRSGDFRQDLLYRLDVLTMRVPALRERADDVPLLVEHFAKKLRERYPTDASRRFSKEVVEALARRPWPGNVRELENAVQRLFLMADGDVVDKAVYERVLTAREPAFDMETGGLVPLRDVEDRYIRHVLERVNGNKTRAAEILGIDPSTLHRRLASS